MTIKLFDRYKTYASFLKTYILVSFLVRLTLYIMSFHFISFSILHVLKIFALGFIFDLGTALFFSSFYLLYLLLVPQKIIGTKFDKIATYIILFITSLIAVFAFMAEFPFWDEYSTRFNFIAVDYLIYTYEVIENIQQSYPLPLLITSIVILVALFIFILHKRKIFNQTFSNKLSFSKKLLFTVPLVLITLIYGLFIKNEQAEWSKNLYENELSKNGVYSFVAAYFANELDYNTFYPTLPENEAISILKPELLQPNQQYNLSNDKFSIERIVTDSGEIIQPNVVLICMESMSGDFMQRFGNKKNITPNLDRLANENIVFNNMYATGTRTVRGMEALTLCVPPTPGNSIVRRPNNDDIFSISNIFKEKNYTNYFIYGGDGHFDNMNVFFSGQGFKIIDRKSGHYFEDDIKTERINIQDSEVQFSNAWGISDEDIFNKTIKIQDENQAQNKKSFYYIMTTSNHKPYSFPKNKIDLPEGTREAAVKYSDFAIGEYLEKAKTKPWYKNTIFIIVADHCANSAGKWDINVSQHHIPAMIVNMPNQKYEINKLVSQIDLMPTVFGLMHWDYTTSLFGKDANLMTEDEERAVIGNYRTLGLLSKNSFVQINDRKQIVQYSVKNGEMTPSDKVDDGLKKKTIAYYQIASYRFKHGLMKNKK